MSVTVAEVEGGEGDAGSGEVRFNGLRVETDLLEVFEGEPADADLMVIGFETRAGFGGVADAAEEDMFELMEGPVAGGEAMIFADVFADVEEAFDLHRDTDFLEAFAVEGFL